MSLLSDWAASEAMALTGRAAGPPLIPPGRAATEVRDQLRQLGLSIPGLLSERAAYLGLRRNGPWSCGGRTRILPTLDGHLVLSLARPEDVALVPALIEAETDDPWAGIAAWAAATATGDAGERCSLLGLPGGAVAERDPGPAVTTTTLGVRRTTGTPLVVDLSSLWAGPLCAHLLGLTGAQVVKVESAARPDGARFGPPAFFDLLHAGHQQMTLDLPRQVDMLAALLAKADLVIESSRPRALRQLGIHAEELVASGTSWLSITACGRSSDAVGFGDDVAARGGLVVYDESDILLVGDAMADPLAGVAAAVAARSALDCGEARLIEISMLGVAASVSAPFTEGHVIADDDGSWWAEDSDGRYLVREPRRRECC